MRENMDLAGLFDVESRVRFILETSCNKNLKLVTAESCTGGLIASLLTDIEGCSHAFERGFIVYSNESKSELLGIDGDKLANYGPVSQEIAEAMAKGALAQSRGDLALAITGFAGPTENEQEEEGLVFLCAIHAGSIKHKELHLGRIGRDAVRAACVSAGLRLLADLLR